MKLNWSHWIYTLLKTVIGGVAATGSAWLGTIVGNQVDHDIPVLQFNQLWSVLLSSSLLNLFFFLKQSPLPDDSDKPSIAPRLEIILIAFTLALGTSGCAWFRPEELKPAPVAVGQDAALVNAERIHSSSLDVYHELIVWETQHRHNLPAEISRAVDRTRREFPKAWSEASTILKDYRLNRKDTAGMNRIAAALAAAQSSMLRLKTDGAQSNDVITALNSLATSIATLKAPSTKATP
jgi:hypothetical protein